MAQACTFGSVKLIVVAFTSIVMILGAALLAISIYLYVDDDNVYLSEEEVSGFESSTIIFIGMGAGAGMVIVSLIGLVGSLTKSSGTLIFFLILLFLTLVLEIGSGILGFVWRDSVQEDLPEEMGKKIFLFKTDKDVEKAWNKIHDKYQCCGRMGYKDWIAANHPSTPSSCEENFKKVGCYYEVERNLKRTLEMGSAALISLSLFQMLVMCFTGIMIIKLNRGEGSRHKQLH